MRVSLPHPSLRGLPRPLRALVGQNRRHPQFSVTKHSHSRSTPRPPALYHYCSLLHVGRASSPPNDCLTGLQDSPLSDFWTLSPSPLPRRFPHHPSLLPFIHFLNLELLYLFFPFVCTTSAEEPQSHDSASLRPSPTQPRSCDLRPAPDQQPATSTTPTTTSHNCISQPN